MAHQLEQQPHFATIQEPLFAWVINDDVCLFLYAQIGPHVLDKRVWVWEREGGSILVFALSEVEIMSRGDVTFLWQKPKNFKLTF